MLPNRVMNYLDVLAIWVLGAIVATSMGLQFILHELPCPLCLLQRAGLIAIALTLTFNLKFGRQTRHYGFAIIATLLTGAIAARQVLLHIMPDTGSYGFPVFGLSLYVWMIIITVCVLIYSALILIINGFTADVTSIPRFISNFTLAIVLVLAVFNTALVLLECGWQDCPDNPTVYRLLEKYS